jgi:hypothetical protein
LSDFLKKPEVISIVSLMLTILAGFGTLWFQKRQEWLAVQSEKKSSLYIKYLNSIVDNATGGTALNTDIRLTFEIVMTGSDQVIGSLGEYRSYVALHPAGSTSRDKTKLIELVAQLVKSMRLDCYGDGKIPLEIVIKAIPVS